MQSESESAEMTRTVAVIAGGEREAERWIRERPDREKTQYVSIRDGQDCIGRTFDDVVWIGTYYERCDLYNIDREVACRRRPNVLLSPPSLPLAKE